MYTKLVVLACLLTISQSRSVDVKFLKFYHHGTNRIIGGRDANPGEFPHQVSLQVDTLHFCGGTILNERWILTAAHCIKTYETMNSQMDEELSDYPNFAVVAGKHNMDESEGTEQSVLVDKWFVHPKYNSELRVSPYDIALIRVRTPLKLNERVASIALPKESDEFMGNLVLSGWGALNGKVPEPDWPTNLQTVSVPIVNLGDCNNAVKQVIYEETNKWLPVDLVQETNICTGPLNGGVSACAGDSGGPLIKRNNNGKDEVIGVASWIIAPCGRKGAPTMYIKVSAFVDWIGDIISKN